MKSFRLSLLAAFSLMAVSFQAKAGEWIRINQVGYLPDASKVAVYVSNDVEPHESHHSPSWTHPQEKRCMPQDRRM